MVKVKVNPMWHDFFQRVSAKGEGKKSRVELHLWRSQSKAVEGECQVNVKVKHVDNVQWGLHLRSSKEQKVK